MKLKVITYTCCFIIAVSVLTALLLWKSQVEYTAHDAVQFAASQEHENPSLYVSGNDSDRLYADTSVTSPSVGQTTKKVHPEPLALASIPYWDQKRAFASFKQHVDLFDMVSLFWYRLEHEGDIAPYKYAVEDQYIVDFAHEHGVKVFGLIANLPEEENWNAHYVEHAIGDEESRKRHISDILDLVEEKNFDGIDIDYEFLNDDQTNDFTTFVNELAAALHSKGKLLRVAIHPQLAGTETRGQDIAALTGADILAIMTYDEHWESSDPGEIASTPWIREVLQYTQSLGIDMSRVFIGIPFYGYDWKKGINGWENADGLTYGEVVSLINMYNPSVQFNEGDTSPHFSYKDASGITHQVWFEDVRSFEERMPLVHEFGVAGVFFWRLGGEDAQIYDSPVYP